MLIWLNSPAHRVRDAVFLDRDGVLNMNRPDFVKNISELEFYPDALESLAILNRRNISAIIISNQSGINRGFISRDDFWQMHDKMITTAREHGGDIWAAFYCPHRPDENCPCRKPSPAMILKACELFRIQPGRACFMGDSPSDLAAARNAGCGAALIRRPGCPSCESSAEDPTVPVFPDLLQAVLSINSRSAPH